MKKDYQISNEIETVFYTRFRHFEYNNLKKSGDSIYKRRKYAKELIEYLCIKYHIEVAKVMVCNKPQPMKKVKDEKLKLHAYYYFNSKTIKIFNLTAVRKQTVSIHVFIDTLLHEFMHHYDREYLGIKGTPHCYGFNARIKDLKSKLED